MPFADVLSAERIERVFAKHHNLFGGSVYSTVVTLWAFLGQALRDGKEASCRSAVAHIGVHQFQAGECVPTNDTGDYCRARAKLSITALREVATGVAGEASLTGGEKRGREKEKRKRRKGKGEGKGEKGSGRMALELL